MSCATKRSRYGFGRVTSACNSPMACSVVTESELGVEAHLVRAQAELLESLRFRAPGRRQGDVRQCLRLGPAWRSWVA